MTNTSSNDENKIEKFGYHDVPIGIDKRIVEITNQIWAREIESGKDKIRVSSKLYAKAKEISTEKTKKNFLAEYSEEEIETAFKNESGPVYSILSDYWCHILETEREKIEKRLNVDIEHDGEYIGIMYIGQHHTFKGFTNHDEDIEIELKDDINDSITLMKEICKLMIQGDE